MTPDAASPPLRDRIDADRKRLLARLARAARRVRKRSDPEATHDVRVTTRQLDALLDVWRGSLPDRRRRQARNALRDLRRGLGPARESRVGVDLMTARLAELDTEAQIGVAVLIDRWNRRLERLERRAASACSKAGIRAVDRRVAQAFQAVAPGPDDDRLRAAEARLEQRRTRAVERVHVAVANATDPRLHAARVAVKRWRYAIDRLAAVGREPVDSNREALVSLQTWLGRIQDTAVLRARLLPLRARLEKMSASAASDTVARLVADLERERLECIETFRRHVLATSLSPAPVLPLPPMDRRVEG
jgi:CHAD domain-containing protein